MDALFTDHPKPALLSGNIVGALAIGAVVGWVVIATARGEKEDAR